MSGSAERKSMKKEQEAWKRTAEKMSYILNHAIGKKWLDLDERQREAYNKLFEIEYQLIELVRLGTLKNPVVLHTYNGATYLTKAQIEFEQIKKNLFLAKNEYFGYKATGRTEDKAYRNLVKKYKILEFSDEEE